MTGLTRLPTSACMYCSWVTFFALAACVNQHVGDDLVERILAAVVHRLKRLGVRTGGRLLQCSSSSLTVIVRSPTAGGGVVAPAACCAGAEQASARSSAAAMDRWRISAIIQCGIAGYPAAPSTERLDVGDRGFQVLGFAVTVDFFVVSPPLHKAKFTRVERIPQQVVLIAPELAAGWRNQRRQHSLERFFLTGLGDIASDNMNGSSHRFPYCKPLNSRDESGGISSRGQETAENDNEYRAPGSESYRQQVYSVEQSLLSSKLCVLSWFPRCFSSRLSPPPRRSRRSGRAPVSSPSSPP